MLRRMKVHERTLHVLGAEARHRVIVPGDTAPAHARVDFELVRQGPLTDGGGVVEHRLQIVLAIARLAGGEGGRKNNNGPANADRSERRTFADRGHSEAPRVTLLFQRLRDAPGTQPVTVGLYHREERSTAS